MRDRIDKLDRIVEITKEIKRLEKELSKILKDLFLEEAPQEKPAKRKISAEARARIAAAQKERWARIHANQSVKQSGKQIGA
jgi:phosphorylcholine metabolism protein LicD